MTKREMNQQWGAAVKAAARARAVPNGSGWVATVDDLYVVRSIVTVHDKRNRDGTWTTTWQAHGKPLVIDELFWRTLDHDSDIADRKLNVRVRAMGAFSLYGLSHGWSNLTINGPGVEIDVVAADAIAVHEERAHQFRVARPDLQAYAAAVDAHRAERTHVPHVQRVERAFLAIALDDLETARRLADEAVEEHERAYSVGDRSIWQLLIADMDAGTGVFA